jgi:tRNA U34 2-thiouridine synthase MnmA/TrmU
MSIITRAISEISVSYWGINQPEVREIATEMELITAERKIRKVCVLLEKYVCQSFTAKLQPKEGLIIQIDKMIGLQY